LIVVMETGCGIPIAPGEIAVLTGAIAASSGKLDIVAVIAVGAAAAIIGDNIGYVIGRKGGRALLERPGPFLRQRTTVIGMADWFFDRHGPKTVFIGRWLPFMRVYTSWLAGASKMNWRTFAVWNAAGGIVWAVSIGLFGYFVGSAATSAIKKLGIYGVFVVVAGAVVAVIVMRRQHARFALASEERTAERAASGAQDELVVAVARDGEVGEVGESIVGPATDRSV
jgi:membrane protein DedA with SNARE-associated domain